MAKSKGKRDHSVENEQLEVHGSENPGISLGGEISETAREVAQTLATGGPAAKMRRKAVAARVGKIGFGGLGIGTVLGLGAWYLLRRRNPSA